jgi:hypothetical protein
VTDLPPRPAPAPKIDITVPNSARIWNYWLGGRDHYEVDRVAGYQFSVIFPGIADLARADRVFLGRAVQFLVCEAGIRQFLDIGTGLPTADNTHELAQRLAPESRVVYVDNDPLVLAYARALLTSTDEGVTGYVDADMRQAGTILRKSAEILDLSQPVGLMLMGVLGHITDYGQARSLVDELLDGLPRGSFLAANHSINTSEALERALQRYAQTGAAPYRTCTPEEFTGFFESLELVEPGVVPVAAWRPALGPAELPEDLPTLGAVGRKK